MLRLPRKSAGALVALILLVVGCTPGADSDTTSSTSTSTLPRITTTTIPPGPSVSIGVEQTDFNFNPFSATQSFSQRVVGNAVWATIYDIDPDTWERIPDVVLALPSQTSGGVEVNEDGSMTVQYQVDPNARWSDGVPISGADIAFTAETMRDLAAAGNPSVDPIMAKVTAVDAAQNVAWITFGEQSLAYEDALWVILPAHALREVDIASSDGFGWPSGGPFLGVPGTQGTELVANPFYWKTDDQGRSLPLIDSVTIVPVLDEPASKFNAGEVDVVEFEASPAGISGDSLSNGAEMQRVPSPILEHLTFNFRDSRQESNPDSLNASGPFRSAVAHSVDPAIYVNNDLVYFEGGPPGVLTPRDGSAFDQYVFDPAEARALVDETDAEDPSSVINTTGNGALRIDIAEALVPSLGTSGIDLTPEFVDSVVFFGDVLPNSTFDIGMWAWVSDGGFQTTMQLLDTFDPAGSTDGYNGWGEGDAATDQSERFSEIVVEASTVTSREEFDALVDESESILAEQLPILPLFQRASNLGVWTNHVSNVRHNATSSRFTWNIEEWEVTGG